MSGILYLVATPIGNLNDMSVRGVETLREADFIAAEDTRVTGKLLNRFEIKKPSVSYHEHNKRQSGEAILRRLLAGETCALVTDAGMPAISDPGEDLVRLCAEHGVEVIAVPGCCAAVTALAVSGLPSRRFCFEGFLPMEKKERLERLEALKTEKRTSILYEAPHRLMRTLTELHDALGDRELAICRELRRRCARRSPRQSHTLRRHRRKASSCSCSPARRRRRRARSPRTRPSLASAPCRPKDSPARTPVSRLRKRRA